MTSNEAPMHFVKSLSSSGFAVIYNHGLDIKLINDTYKDWMNFFSTKNKFNYLFDYEKQDGYFPFKSENAQGSDSKDLKEFFHIYSWGRYPEEVSNYTNEKTCSNIYVHFDTALELENFKIKMFIT